MKFLPTTTEKPSLKTPEDAFNPNTQQVEKVDFYEFILVYVVSSRTVRAVQRDPALKQ